MYYADQNAYGVGTMTTLRRRGKEIAVSTAQLHRFETAALRDAWVDADPCPNGRATRQALTATQARKDHRAADLTRSGAWYFWGDDTPAVYGGIN